MLSLVFISDYMTLKGFNVFQFQILSEKFQDLAFGTCLLQLSYLTRANLGSILQTGLFKLLLPRVVWKRRLSGYLLFRYAPVLVGFWFLGQLVLAAVLEFSKPFAELRACCLSFLFQFYNCLLYRVSRFENSSTNCFASGLSLFSGYELSQEMLFTGSSPFAIGCSMLYFSAVKQSQPTMDFDPFFATSTLPFDILVFPTCTLTNMYSSSDRGRLLKATNLSLSIFFTTTQCSPMIFFSSSTAKIEIGDPVSIIALNLLPHIRPSIMNGLTLLPSTCSTISSSSSSSESSDT